MGAGKRVLTAVALALLLSSQVPADTRKENIDVIIALDKSLSMENKIGAVETWVNSFILDQLVVPGDFLTVIPFYGKTDPLISTEIKGDAELLALNDALDELARIDERQAKIVELKFFGGLSAPEISELMGISRATIDRDWATARVWLHRQMSRTASS